MLFLWKMSEKRKRLGRVEGWGGDRQRNQQVNVRAFVKTTLAQPTLEFLPEQTEAWSDVPPIFSYLKDNFGKIECTKCRDFSAIAIAIFCHRRKIAVILWAPRESSPLRKRYDFGMENSWRLRFSVCDFSRKKASPLRFGWRQGRLRQNITAICNCDYWCSQLKEESPTRRNYLSGRPANVPGTPDPPRRLQKLEVLFFMRPFSP